MTKVQVFLAGAVAVAAVAAWFDWRKGEIPNVLTFGALGVGIAGHAAWGAMAEGVSGAGWAALFSLLGAVTCAIVPIVLFSLGAMGGGDVKLLVAVGAICRTLVGVEAEFYAFIAAAIWAPARLAYEGKLLRTLGQTAALALNPILPKARRRAIAPEMMTSLRFGPAIFAGTAAAALLHWGGT